MFMLRPVRTLLAWLERDEAMTALLGRIPAPDEDVAALVADWEAKRAAQAERPAYSLAPPALEPLQDVLTERGHNFLQRPDVQASFAGFQWELGIANLEHVLSYQKVVVLEQVEERIAAVTQDS
jgi:hypothetical protein